MEFKIVKFKHFAKENSFAGCFFFAQKEVKQVASINTKFRLSDYMSPALKKISTNLKTCINNFQSLQAISSHAVDTASLERNAQILQKMQQGFSDCENAIHSADAAQKNFNDSMKNGSDAASNMVSKLKSIAATVASIQTIKKAVELSDEMASTTARLNLMVDDGSSAETLRSKIYASAQAARGDYMNTLSSVSQLGILAGSAFNNNDEIVKFTELMNKNFTIAGASTSERNSAMLQLTQAMASGRLQGDEYRSIIENAPLLAQSIENYMRAGGVTGAMKDWSSQGMLTADVIKNALFASADEVEQRFNSIPKTWSSVWTEAKNTAVAEFQPVLDKINEIANSEKMEQILAKLPDLFENLANVACTALDLITDSAAWLLDNLSWIAPIVTTAVGAFLAFKTVITIINGVSSAIMFLTSPIGMVVLAIGLVILAVYQIVDLINEVTGSAVSATGIIFGAVAFLGASIMNLVSTVWNLLVDVAELLWNLFADLANFFGNVFDDPVGSVCHLFVDLADFVLGIVETLARAIDTLFGSNLAGALAGWRNKIQNWADNTFGEQKVYVERTDMSWMRGKFQDPFAAYNSGYNAGANLENMFTIKPNTTKASTGTNLDYLNYGELPGIAEDTKKIADNTSKSEEDLKLLREIAEREAINRFTTAEVKVDMTGMTNTISNTTDIDGFINIFTDRFEKALLSAAEGVHV